MPANLAGHNGTEHRALNSLVIFPLAVTASAIAFGWIRSNSKSIWSCVYLHGVINAVSDYWLIKPNTELIEKLSGLGMWLVIGGIFLIMTERKNRSVSSAWVSV